MSTWTWGDSVPEEGHVRMDMIGFRDVKQRFEGLSCQLRNIQRSTFDAQLPRSGTWAFGLKVGMLNVPKGSVVTPAKPSPERRKACDICGSAFCSLRSC